MNCYTYETWLEEMEKPQNIDRFIFRSCMLNAIYPKKKRVFYIHVTVHRDKFPYNKTN
jgi:hypothetical protein